MIILEPLQAMPRNIVIIIGIVKNMVIKLFTNLLVSVIKNYVYFTVVGNHGNRSSGGSFLLSI